MPLEKDGYGSRSRACLCKDTSSLNFQWITIKMPDSSLLDVTDSLLVAIDIQPSFVRKESEDGSDALLRRMCWVIKVANWLQVPLVVTAEDIHGNGSVSSEVAELLPPNAKIYNKMIFGLAAQPDILEAVRETKRNTAVLIGYETDVCIAHSALGLLDLGYRVAVVADATGSPGNAHQFGLERIRGAGGIIVSAKGLFYEWVRTVEKSQEFGAFGIDPPEGIIM
jgi:nicotinamidase-related amidase